MLDPKKEGEWRMLRTVSWLGLGAIMAGLVGMSLGLPSRQVWFLVLLSWGGIVLWQIHQPTRQRSQTPVALPVGEIKTAPVVEHQRKLALLQEDGPVLSPSEARQALDEFLVEQQRNS